MNEPTESVVLCEGYHDRAFWAGWLLHLGCTDPGAGNGARGKLVDPWNKPVTRGHFGFRSTSGRFVRLQPCHSREKVIRAARIRLSQLATQSLTRLVVCVDSDRVVAEVTGVRHPKRAKQYLVGPLDLTNAKPTADGDLVLSDGRTLVSLVCWEAPDPRSEEIPAKQTLERLICAALIECHAERGPWVRKWLDSRPEGPPAPPAAGPKEFAFSHMAGWYAEHGCEDFFRHFWRDEDIAKALERRLRDVVRGGWPRRWQNEVWLRRFGGR